MRFQELLGLDEIPTSVDFSTGESHEEDGLHLHQSPLRQLHGGDDIGRPGQARRGRSRAASGSRRDARDRKLWRGGNRSPDVPARRRARTPAWLGTRAREEGLCGADLLSEGHSRAAQGRSTTGRRRPSCWRPTPGRRWAYWPTRPSGPPWYSPTIDGVDADRTGLTGMSLGGLASWLAMSMAPVDPDLRRRLRRARHDGADGPPRAGRAPQLGHLHPAHAPVLRPPGNSRGLHRAEAPS